MAHHKFLLLLLLLLLSLHNRVFNGSFFFPNLVMHNGDQPQEESKQI